MIPKTIHLCWFGNDPYPVEIKICLDSWARLLPDYKVKVWTYDMAKAIGIPFVDEALEERKWAFAADVVRFYALFTEGGLYLDSDIMLFKRFDEFLPDEGCMTFSDKSTPEQATFGLQAAFIAGSPGNKYCQDAVDYYRGRHFRKADGTLDETAAPWVMRTVALKYGYRDVDDYQDLGVIKIYPARFMAPRKKYKVTKEAVGQHRAYGSWRKHKLGRKIDRFVHHIYYVVRYHLLHR